MGNGSPGAMERRSSQYRFADQDDTQDAAPLAVPVLLPTSALESSEATAHTEMSRRMSMVGLQRERSGSVVKFSTTKKEFAQWVCAMDPRVCGTYQNGERLLTAMKQELCRTGAQKLVSKCRMTTVEALACLMYTSDTSVVGELNTCLKRSGMLEPFEPFLSPLLSGMAKLPRFEGVLFRVLERRKMLTGGGGEGGSPMLASSYPAGPGGGAAAAGLGKKASTGWGALRKNLSNAKAVAAEIDGNNPLPPLWPLAHQESFPSFSSGSSSMLTAEQVQMFQSPRNTCILCMKAHSGRVLGDLTFQGDASNEVVLLPGWVGKVVGYVEPQWKKMLSALWGFDVTAYEIIELVEIGSQEGTGFVAGDLLNDLLQRLQQTPDSLELLRYLVILYHHLGDKDKERQFLMQILLLDGQDFDANRTMALLLEGHYKDYDGAWKHYERALAVQPGDSDLQFALGKLWEVHFKDPKRAKRCYELGLRNQPNHADAHARLGFIHETFRDDLERAKTHYESALLTDPKHAEAAYFMGRLLWNEVGQPNWQRAKALLETSVATNSSAADPHYWLGIVLEDPKVRDFIGAKFQFEMAVHLDTQHAAAHGRLGCVLFNNFREPKNALDHLLLSVKADQNNELLHGVLGRLYETDVHDYGLARRHYEMAIRLNFEMADTHCRLGELLEKHFSDPKKAKKHYEHAIRIEAQHPDAHTNLGWIIERFAQEPELAKRHYEIALAAAPSHAKAHHRLGNIFLSVQKHYDKARLHFEKSILDNPRDAVVHHDVATLLELHFQEHGEARMHYETSLGIDDTNAQCQNDFGLLLLTHHHNIPMAQDHLVKAVELRPDFPDAHNNLGLSLQMQLEPIRDKRRVELRDDVSETASSARQGPAAAASEDPHLQEIAEGARTEFEHTIQLNPKHFGAHYNLGTLLASKWYRENKLARKHFETAIRLNGQDCMARVHYGLVLERHFTEYRAAAAQYEAAIRINQHYGPAHNYLGRVLSMHIPCDLSKPRSELEVAIKLVPEDADAHHNLAMLYDLKLGLLEEAKEHYEQAVKLDPNFHDAHYNLGVMLTKKLGDHARARRHMHLAVKLHPEAAEYHKSLAFLLIQQFEDYKNAVRHFKMVIQLDGSDPDVHLAYGQILENYYQEYEMAKQRFEKALTLDPNSTQLHNALALLLRKRFRDTEGAMHHFHETLTIDPTNDCALTNLHRMRVIAGGYAKVGGDGGAVGPAMPPPLEEPSGPPSHSMDAAEPDAPDDAAPITPAPSGSANLSFDYSRVPASYAQPAQPEAQPQLRPQPKPQTIVAQESTASALPSILQRQELQQRLAALQRKNSESLDMFQSAGSGSFALGSPSISEQRSPSSLPQISSSPTKRNSFRR